MAKQVYPPVPGKKFVVLVDNPQQAQIRRGTVVITTQHYRIYVERDPTPKTTMSKSWYIEDFCLMPMDGMSDLEKAIYGE